MSASKSSLMRSTLPSHSAPMWINVCFSNRPFQVEAFRPPTTTVSMSLTGSCFSVEIGAKALPSSEFEDKVEQSVPRPYRYRLTVNTSRHANSPHPSSREGHHSTTGWISSVLLLHLIVHGSHAATTSRVQRKSVPSTQMRCMITANRPAKATIAFFIPTRTSFHHQPEAQHPKIFSYRQDRRPIIASCCLKSDKFGSRRMKRAMRKFARCPKRAEKSRLPLVALEIFGT